MNPLNLIIAAAVVVGAPLVARFLARSWRMPDYRTKFTLILFTIFAGAAIVAGGVLEKDPDTGRNAVKLGIDLRGGAILVYEMLAPEGGDPAAKDGAKPGDTDGQTKSADNVDMDKMIVRLKQRLDPSGVEQISIRKMGLNQVEIIIPDVDEQQRQAMQEKISATGSLEFRILATEQSSRHQSIISQARALKPEESVLRNRDTGKEIARWVPISEDSQFSPGGTVYRIVPRREKQVTQVLVVADDITVTGEQLRSSTVGTDEKMQPCVNLLFDSRGSLRFSRLTSKYQPDPTGDFLYKLGIILDGKLFTAPDLRSAITEGRCEISGGFVDQIGEDGEPVAGTGRERAQRLVDVLNAGSLPAVLSKEPVSSQVIGPTLGQDTIERGLESIVISIVLVFVTVLVYYRFAGFVAALTLTLNGMLLLAVMITVKAAFTLPGLAGFALTLGMAVDANVLIFERMREEQSRQASLRMTIREGFGKAWSAIFDSNVTTIITSIILYTIGTDIIRSFAITLLIGLLLNLFTAVFIGRVIFEIAERRRWITSLKMMQAVRATRFNFLGFAPKFLVVMAIVTVAGLLATVNRGLGLFDIDLTGGVSTEVLFEQPQKIADVRKSLETAKEEDGKSSFPDVVVTEARQASEPDGLRFRIAASTPTGEDANLYRREMEQRLAALFGDRLQMNSIELGEMVTRVTATEPAPVPTPEPSVIGPAPVEEPVVNEEPMATEEPVVNEEPTATEEPVVNEEPKATEEPVVNEEPTATEEPVVNEEPKATEEPVVTEEPKATEEPVVTEEPAVAVRGGHWALMAASSMLCAQNDAATDADAAATDAPKTDAPKTEEAPLTVTAADVVFPNGSAMVVKIGHPMAADAVTEAVTEALTALGKPDVAVEVTNPRWDREEGEKQQFDSWIVHVNLPETEAGEAFAKTKELYEQRIVIPSSNTVGSMLASQTRDSAVWAILLSCVLMLLYLRYRFHRISYGIAAVIALVFDVLFTLAALGASAYLAPALGWLMIEPFKINMTVITALLTVVGYSINDKIVIFDRIRELRGKGVAMSPDLLNRALNQTLARTLLTSLTTLVVLAVLYIFGGSTIHGFAFAMLVGIIVGTFSSMFVAVPALLWLSRKFDVNRDNTGGGSVH